MVQVISFVTIAKGAHANEKKNFIRHCDKIRRRSQRRVDEAKSGLRRVFLCDRNPLSWVKLVVMMDHSLLQ